VILFERRHIFADVLLLDDDSLKQELPQVFLRYLGVKDSAEFVTAPAQSDRSGRGSLVRHRAETGFDRNRASARDQSHGCLRGRLEMMRYGVIRTVLSMTS
jgi:hypothetical protein